MTETPPHLVLIGGIERSGTTVLATTIARRLASTVLPESQWKLALSHDLRKGKAASLDPAANFRYALWDLPAVAFDRATAPAQAFWQVVRSLEARHDAGSSAVYLDHTPHNLAKASALVPALRPALVIHIERDPAATIASIMHTDWGLPTFRSALRFWQERHDATEAGLRYLRAEAPERLVEIRYEELCRDPLGAIGPVLDRLRPLTRADTGRSRVFLPDYTKQQHRRILQDLRNDRPDPGGRTAYERGLLLRTLAGRGDSASVGPAGPVGNPEGPLLDRMRFEVREGLRSLQRPIQSVRRKRRRAIGGMSALEVQVLPSG